MPRWVNLLPNKMPLPFHKKKFFGQHFLHDQQIIHDIVDSFALKFDDRVVEIGPGAGALTTVLLQRLKFLDAIEIDQEIIPFLQNNCHHVDNLRIHHADVLKFDFRQFNDIRLVGNLPYNISTPILFHLVKNVAFIRDMNFMLQREVAERITATAGSKVYGRLSVMMQYYFEVNLGMQIPATAFTPEPKVISSLVRFIPRSRTFFNGALLGNIVRDAFSQRRKTLANGLKKYITAKQLTALNIDPCARPEILTVDQFVCIARWLEQNPIN